MESRTVVEYRRASLWSARLGERVSIDLDLRAGRYDADAGFGLGALAVVVDGLPRAVQGVDYGVERGVGHLDVDDLLAEVEQARPGGTLVARGVDRGGIEQHLGEAIVAESHR